LKCSSGDICSNKKLVHDKSTTKEKAGDIRAGVGVHILESNQIARENVNRYMGGNYKVLLLRLNHAQFLNRKIRTLFQMLNKIK